MGDIEVSDLSDEEARPLAPLVAAARARLQALVVAPDERLRVARTDYGGLGLFAAAPLAAGDRVGVPAWGAGRSC